MRGHWLNEHLCGDLTDSVPAEVVGAWPRFRLNRIPSAEETVELALSVRSSLLGAAASSRPLGDVAEICRAGGFRLRERPLGGARGGLEAVIAPAPEDRFEIHVDPEPRGGWGNVPEPMRATLRRQRLRFRVAHEIAHSFFYERDGSMPRRSLGNSRRQEEFCDRFAAEFLLPSGVAAATECSASALLGLSRRYDVSLQVAARSCAAQWPEVTIALLVAKQGTLMRQWAAGEHHLPEGWWRQAEKYELSRWERFEVEALERACGFAGVQALPLAERKQVLLVGRRG